MVSKSVFEKYKLAPHAGCRVRFEDGNSYLVISPAIIEESSEINVVFEVESTGEHFLYPLSEWDKKFEHPKALNTSHWANKPLVSSHWRHFKGNSYRVITNAHDEDGDHYVIYKADSDGIVWARLIESWESTVEVKGKTIPRFSMI